MAKAMTLDEAKLILSEEDLSYLSMSELSGALNILRSSAIGDPDAKALLDSVDTRISGQSIRYKIRDNATFREYEDACAVLDKWQYTTTAEDGSKVMNSFKDELDARLKKEALAYIDNHIQAKVDGKNSLENLSWPELAEVKAMYGHLDDFGIDTKDTKNSKVVLEFADDFKGVFDKKVEETAKAEVLSTLDARDFEALKQFYGDMPTKFADPIELAARDYAKEYDILNGLDDFDAKIVNQNAIALNRVIGTTTLENISKNTEINKLFESIRIPALDDNQEIAKDEKGKEIDCTEEKKQEYIESLFESARAQVLKDNLNNPFFFTKETDSQRSDIEKAIRTQISTDVLTMYVASGINEGVSNILKEKLGIEEPNNAQKIAGSEAQFAYNQKISGELSKAFADPDKMTEVMDSFNEYMETIASADGKIRVSPHQFLANQADKQVELKDFRARLQTIYKEQKAPAAGAIVARRQETKLQSVGERVFGKKVYGFAVAVKDFAKNNTGKAMEIAGTLGIAAGSVSLSIASIGQRFGIFGEGAQQFLGGTIGTTLASAMVLHTAAKSLVYPVVSEWKAMANDKGFAEKGFFAKYRAARAEAKKKDPNLNSNLYIAGAAVVTSVAGGLFLGPMGSRMAAAATIAVGNYIIKQFDYNRTKKLYKQTGDEKYRIALYGNKGSEDIQNAKGLKKAWKKTMNFLGAKRNQTYIAGFAAFSSFLGFASRLGAAEHAGTLGGVKTGSSTLESTNARASLGVKAPAAQTHEGDSSNVAKTKMPETQTHKGDSSDVAKTKMPETQTHKGDSSNVAKTKLPETQTHKGDSSNVAKTKMPATQTHEGDSSNVAKTKMPETQTHKGESSDVAKTKMPETQTHKGDSSNVAKTKLPETQTHKGDSSDVAKTKLAAEHTSTSKTAGTETPSGKGSGTEAPTGEATDATDMKIPAYNKEMGISQKQFNTLLSTRTEAEITKMYSNLTDDVMKKNFPNMTREQLMYKYNRLDAWTARVKSDGKGNLIPLLDKAGNPVARYQMDAEMKTLKKIIECGESVDEKSLKAATAGLGHIKTDGDTDLSGPRTSNRITKLVDEGCDEHNHAYGKGGSAPVKVNVTSAEVKEMPVLKMAGLPLEPAELPTHLEPMNLTTPIAVPTETDHSYLYVPAAYGRELLIQGAFDAKGAPVLSGDAALDARTIWASPIDADKPKGNIQLTRYFNGEFIGNKSDVVKAKDLGHVIGVFDDANKAGEVVLEGKAKIAVVNVATGDTSVEKINLNAKGMPNTFAKDMTEAGNVATDAGKKVNKVVAAAFAAKSGAGR